ncbi:MAG: hypothetical protein HOQ09_03325 [Gemmatimonadaceae bacterium]|nr:hypothetical protein [Gemmatimonadaceae bacterium]
MAAQDVQQEAYKQKREELVKELQQTQSALSDLRAQRVQLQARIENVIAQMMQQRAQALLMSNESNALQQLDAMLTSSQDNLLAQRDRFTTIADAVRRRSGSMLVVLLRADSSTGPGQILGNATLQVDNAQVDSRSYTVTANSALRQGAVDQVYRADVLPTSHTVTLQITVNGQPMTQTMNVTAAGETVTYVQFAVRNGQVVPSTWTSRGTTPF